MLPICARQAMCAQVNDMGQIIINGKNGGYPTLEELPDAAELEALFSPYPLNIQKTDGKNGGYPHIGTLPNAAAEENLSPLYPRYMMRCVSGVNDGYPTQLPMNGLAERLNIRVKFGDMPVRAVYFNGRQIIRAYCNEETVIKKLIESI